MTFETMRDAVCGFFSVDVDKFMSSSKGDDESIARHIFRAVMWNKYAKSKASIARFESKGADSIGRSCKMVINDGMFKKEYEAFLESLEKKPIHVEIVTDPNGIQRITNDAFDERYYAHPTRVNTRTGLPYFPAFHYITSIGEPTPFGLVDWYKKTGVYADNILDRSQVIGSYVHDTIDRMIKNKSAISAYTIDEAFSDAKEAHRVKECLLGFLNFMRDEEPIILASEKMECGDDFGFTIDNIFRIKSDKYKNVWASDWKTSKVANDGHKMQIEAIRRTVEADRGMIVVLGNSTKKKYTLTKLSEKDHDYYWDRFLSVKDTAYVEMLKKGQVKPRENNMPDEFSLEGINVKFKL